MDTKSASGDPRSRADAQWSITQVARRTGFREQYYTGMKQFYSAGKVAGQNVKKLYMRIGRFFMDIFRLINSFGLRLFVELDIDHIHHVECWGSPGKSIRKSSTEAKVVNIVKNEV